MLNRIGIHIGNLIKCTLQASDADEEQRMVWKVKRRPDGSRYIVRRPVQSRAALRNRELKINAERSQNCCGNEVTTEDDTMSEIKLGRYWNKDERKKHMERAKERRYRQEQVLENVKLLQRKNQLNTIQASGSGEETSATTAVNKMNAMMIMGNSNTNGGMKGMMKGGGSGGIIGTSPGTTMTSTHLATAVGKLIVVDQQQAQPVQQSSVDCKDNKIMGLLSVTTV